MKFSNKIHLFISILFLNTYSIAQNIDYKIEKIADQNGRTLGLTRYVLQDSIGYMWFATQDGLIKYDGYQTIKYNKEDSVYNIPINNIAFFNIAKDQTIWIKHIDKFYTYKNNQTINKYNIITDSVYSLSSKMIEDAYDNLWIGPNDEAYYKYAKNNEIEIFKHKPEQYIPNLYKIIDSLIVKKNIIAKIPYKPDISTKTEFNISENAEYLIINTGEYDGNFFYDFGEIHQYDKLLYRFSKNALKYSGGSWTNIVQCSVLKLKKGKYVLKYQSDKNYENQQWIYQAPDKINFRGIAILKVDKASIQKIKKLLSLNYEAPNNIKSEKYIDQLIDISGNLCLLTEKGIERFNPQKNEFNLIKINYNKILDTDNYELFAFQQNNDTTFWIATDLGIIKFDIRNLNYKIYSNRKNSLNYTKIYNVFCDSRLNTWLATNNGAYIINNQNDQISKYDIFNGLYSNEIFNFYEDKSLNIWIATKSGVNIAIPTKFKYHNLNINALNKYEYAFDKSGKLYFDAGNFNIGVYNFETENKNKISLNEFLLNDKSFQFGITDLFFDNKNNLWIAIDNFLMKLNTKTKKIDFKYQFPDFEIFEQNFSNYIWKIIQNSDNNIYLFTNNGIYSYSYKNKQISNIYDFTELYAFVINSDTKFIKDVIKDDSGAYWIRTSLGLYIFENEDLNEKIRFNEDFIGTESTNGNIFTDQNGSKWLAILPFIYKINNKYAENKTFEFDINMDIGFNHIAADINNNLWIYTDNGAFKFDSININSYTIKDGLLSNNIIGILSDKKYNYIISAKGINIINKENEEIDNLQIPNERNQLDFLSLGLYNEKIYLFTKKGIFNFNIKLYNKQKPNVAISNIYLFGEKLNINSLHNKDALEFNYNQNFLIFEFVGLEFTEPNKNQYKYILENLDKRYNFVDANNRKAVYTAIPPGTYVFKVQAANNEGVWNKNGVALKIIIHPPWWKTTFAFAFYFVFAILCIYIIIRLRTAKLKREKAILEHKVAERTFEIEQKKAEIETQKDEIEKQKNLAEKQKKSITDSIEYASRIQKAVLPPNKSINSLLNDYFIINIPRDIVSGDFYWMHQYNHKAIIVAADCTGHGVPGAFMSMLGVAFLNEIVAKMKSDNQQKIAANEILNQLRQTVIRSLHQTGKENESKDGMDISLCIIDPKHKTLEYAGANNSAYIVRQNPEKELITLKADRMPIGYYYKIKPFKSHILQLKSGDFIYILSDGYIDQFGEKTGRKYMTKRFKELILDISHLKPNKQKEIMLQKYYQWKGNLDQLDDILIVGINIV